MNRMHQNQGDDVMEARSRELFNEQVANLDGHTRSRLNRVRQAALDAARHEMQEPIMRWLMPAGGVAALALMALFGWQVLQQTPEPGKEVVVAESAGVITGAVDDLELITDSAELELLQNMDFYAWLGSQTDSALPAAEDG